MPAQTIQKSTRGRDLHPDPITGEPGAHPVGTAVGAVAGGLAGKGVAESIDPRAEDAYWREHHREQKYTAGARPFDAYALAYRVGYTGYSEGLNFEDREADLRMEYEGGPQKAEAEVARAESRNVPDETIPGTMQNNMSPYPLRWDEAREAARAAYERVRRGEATKRTDD